MSTVVKVSGPWFTPERTAIITRFCRESERVIGEEGVTQIKERLPKEYSKDPWRSTGNYESHIQTERQITDLAVRDGMVVYGPWLEGVGSRNYPRSSFRGYHTFRQIGISLNRSAQGIAEVALRPYLEELNGV